MAEPTAAPKTQTPEPGAEAPRRKSKIELKCIREAIFNYQKERRDFGRQVAFGDRSEVLVSIPPNRELMRDFVLRNPVSRSTQKSVQMARSVINTEAVSFESRGVFHTEGGWPKDVNYKDPEHTVRYRRKIEKDDNFINQVTSMGKMLESAILQNNAVNIYEKYFEELEPPPLMERSNSRTINVYRDPQQNKRPVTHISWSPDGGVRLAVSHCDAANPGGFAAESYVWETENPNHPLLALKPPSPALCVEFNNKDITSLVSGLWNGQVAAWDTRAGSDPIMTSEREISHIAQVNTVIWNQSKSGTEFFSGSSDGQVMWWDTRKPDEPLDRLMMDPQVTNEQELSRSYGVSVLEYEMSMPTRFMAGTEQGMMFVCNRKGKTPIEKIPLRLQCHTGPIYCLARNPSFVKNFLTVGDWVARIWSEDCRESSIIWTKNHRHMLTDGCWSPTKCSLFFLSSMDGVLDAWDLLQQQNEPTLSVKICDDPILCLRIHDNGSHIATGTSNGIAYLLEISENLSTTNKNDKPLMTAMLERENKRERILESKVKEAKLRIKAQQREEMMQVHRQAEMRAMKPSSTKAHCETAVAEYFESVEAARKEREQDPENQRFEVDFKWHTSGGDYGHSNGTNGSTTTNGHSAKQ